MTLFGAFALDATPTPQSTSALVEPLVFAVGSHNVVTDSIPVALTDISAAIDHSVWFNNGYLEAVPPVGPDGISLGISTKPQFCHIKGHTNLRHPVVFDFDATSHILPITAGTSATIEFLGDSTKVIASRSIKAGKSSNSSTAEVVIAASLLGVSIRADPDGTATLMLEHDHGSLREAAMVATTVLIAAYLSILAGKFRRTTLEKSPTTRLLPWHLLALDGPLCALSVIFSNGGHAGDIAWAYTRNTSILVISAAGIALALLAQEKENVQQRRLLEPALITALQAPFAGRTGILAQTLCGIAISAVAVRDLGKQDIKTTDSLFALSVVLWMSPLLIMVGVQDALQTAKQSTNYPIALALSLAIAALFLGQRRS